MLAKEIQEYLVEHSNVQDDILHAIERSTHLHTIAPQMLSGRLQGHFLTLLTSLVQARHVLEVGTFTAYGSICLARGLQQTPESKVVTIEANPELSFLIEKHLSMAQMTDKVECLTGDALKIIPDRPEEWDLVFIDANKQEYPDYYKAIIDRVRPGGLILSDNVLWSGKVIHNREDLDANVLHQYNQMLHRDPKVEVLMLPIRDGLSIARKL